MSGGIGLLDCDNDGKLDIVTVNGSTVDRYRHGGDPLITLYHQDSDLKFTDITKSAGLTRKGWGMGVAVADYDNDGLQDIYVTGFGGNALYHNLGNCKFEDVTDKAGVAGGGFSSGAAWADYDRDGKVDLFVSRYVHVDIDKLPELGSDPRFCRFKGVLVQSGPSGLPGESDLLFHNEGDGTFEEVSKKAGVDDPNQIRPAVVVIVSPSGAQPVVVPPSLLLNRNQNPNHRVLFKLIGTKSNKAAIGAQLTVKAGDLVQFSEVRGGASYL